MRDTFYERKLISGAPNDAPQARMGTFFGHMQLNLDDGGEGALCDRNVLIYSEIHTIVHMGKDDLFLGLVAHV